MNNLTNPIPWPMNKMAILTITLFLTALQSVAQFTELNNPFQGAQYESDDRYLRAVTHKTGKSNPEILKEMAVLHARANIVEQMQVQIDTKVKDVVKAINSGLNFEISEEYTKTIRQQASAMLRGSVVRDSRELYSRKDKLYNVWVFVEMERVSVNDMSIEDIEKIRQSLPEPVRVEMKPEAFRHYWSKELK